MEKQKATIFDLARYIQGEKKTPFEMQILLCKDAIDETNRIVLEWCRQHPLQTRQEKFLKLFPNTELNSSGREQKQYINISPCVIDTLFECKGIDCKKCKKEYWLGEVEE